MGNFIKIGTLNVRSLKGEEKILELENAMNDSKIDILGLAEIRRLDEKIVKSGQVHFMSQRNNCGSERGVGFLISPDLADRIEEFKGISDRIATLKINYKKEHIVHVYR